MNSLRLVDIKTRAPEDFDKQQTKEKTAVMLKEIDDLQNMLYAQGKYSLLVILQGMDASGKDGVIRNVFTSVNPQGIRVTSFKAPTAEELSHDFLWRVHAHTPPRGMIQLFNRSHYEDILITRVKGWCDDELAAKRMKAINDFEEMLVENNNTAILKFYLHISPDEQQERLKERIKDPKKQWKYNENDLKEAMYWDEYLKMYEDCFEHCNKVPWIIVPSDQNWYREFTVASHVYKTLKGLKLEYPEMKKGG